MELTLEVAGQVRPAPAGVDLSAYRIIQEALTNVVRHAGTGAACIVSVTYTHLELVIQVTDDGGRPSGRAADLRAAAGLGGSGAAGAGLTGTGVAAAVSAGTGLDGLAAAGAGHGIIGMQERVNLCGGSFSAGTLPDGGFQVIAALPLPPGRLSPGPSPATSPQGGSATSSAVAPEGPAVQPGSLSSSGLSRVPGKPGKPGGVSPAKAAAGW